MNYTTILLGALIVGGLGLLFGALLAIVGKVFAVKEDPRKAEVRECLPGANCGGCGFAGCDAFADAVVEGKAEANGCPVGGAAVAQKVGAIMGTEVEVGPRKVAFVRCRGDLEKCGLRFDYKGVMDCKSAALIGNGDKNCHFSCLGFGDCQKACPFDAIHVTEDRLAIVDEDKCTGCGQCVAACPRSIVHLVTTDHAVHRTCSAMDRGRVVRDNCTAGCLGCGKCERACKFDALKMRDNLPHIDFTKCVDCMQCADSCPTGALKANNALRKHALIHYTDCTGCDKCTMACQFGAIRGMPHEAHTIIEWNCVGCGKCVEVCEMNCIELRAGGRYAKQS